MKIFPLIAAAAVAFVAMPAAASAAPAPSAPAALTASVAVGQSVRVQINDRRHHGRRAHWRRVCTTKWRHGHRVRTCRRVRTWSRW
jgi:hypothetical protein